MPSSLWRRHWKLAVGVPVALVLLVGTIGARRVGPFTSSVLPGKRVGEDIKGRVKLFDRSTIHEFALTYEQVDYDSLLKSYFGDGTKDVMRADLTIDGMLLPAVGIRLKGNATLRNLRDENGNAAPGGAFPGGGGRVGGGFPGGGPPGGGGFGTALSVAEPEDLPWLVSIDEFVKDRLYEGHRELAIRPPQNITQTTVLNEALSLSMIDAAGEPASDFLYTTLRVNGGTPTLRLVLQNPDDSLAADEIKGKGVIYKSLSTGNFSYRGDDPTAYEGSFKIMNRKKSADLAPVIGLIKWVDGADDFAFRDGLAARIDVESFARYCAFQNLLLNFDDMAGPGQNYLVYYDLSTTKFQIGTWDMNISFSGNASQGPYDAGGFGGFGGGGPPQGDLQPTAGVAFPRGGHKLKERFLASGTFRKVYEAQYRALYLRFFVGGEANRLLDKLAATLAIVPSNAADPAKVTADVEQLRTALTNRLNGLANNVVITGATPAS